MIYLLPKMESLHTCLILSELKILSETELKECKEREYKTWPLCKDKAHKQG